MTKRRTNWKQGTLVERRYGDVLNAKADCKGKLKMKFEDPVVNLFGQWSILGAMCDVHMTTGKYKDDMNRHSEATRAVSFGVYGRTGPLDEIPSWDIVPHPCFG